MSLYTLTVLSQREKVGWFLIGVGLGMGAVLGAWKALVR